MVNYKRLYFLRKHTLLDPLDYIRIKIMQSDAEETQILINKVENCHVGVDYSLADEYEYYSRLKEWMYCKGVLQEWKRHSEGLDLFDFAELIIDENINKEEEGLKNGNIRQRIK